MPSITVHHILFRDSSLLPSAQGAWDREGLPGCPACQPLPGQHWGLLTFARSTGPSALDARADPALPWMLGQISGPELTPPPESSQSSRKEKTYNLGKKRGCEESGGWKPKNGKLSPNPESGPFSPCQLLPPWSEPLTSHLD